MTFSYQLQEHIPEYPPNVTPPEVSHGYWQANLMCHLLDGYDYQTMLTDKVHVAMLKFIERTLTIPDEVNTLGGNTTPELWIRTKVELIKHATAIAEILLRNENADISMGQLYWMNPDAIADKEAVIVHFEAMNAAIANDTHPPHPNQGTNPCCRLCLTFLPRLKKDPTWPTVTEGIMTDFIELIGQNSLKELFRKNWSGNPSVLEGIRLGRKYWILLEPSQ